MKDDMKCLSFKDIHSMSKLKEGRPIDGALTAIPASNLGFEQNRYFTNGKEVYLECKTFAYIKDMRLFFFLQTADAKTFTVLSQRYAKDAKHVYFDEKVVVFADAISFKALSFDYGMDHQYVYWQGKRIAKDIELSSFEVLDNNYAKNAQDVFHGANEIIGAHAASFISCGWGYAKDLHHVYHMGVLLSEPVFDSASFVVLSEYYVKDKHCVYWDNWYVTGADVASFEALNDHYAKDKNHVYLQGRRLEGADAQTFEVIQDYWVSPQPDGNTYIAENWYTKDAKSVYYYNAPIRNADPDSFLLLKAYYAKDKNHVYFNNQIMMHADPKTFVVLNEYYTKDCHHVFYNIAVDQYTEPYSEICDEFYFDFDLIIGQDDGIYYLKGTPKDFYKIVPQADPKTFEVISGDCGKDKNVRYDKVERQ